MIKKVWFSRKSNVSMQTYGTVKNVAIFGGTGNMGVIHHQNLTQMKDVNVAVVGSKNKDFTNFYNYNDKDFKLEKLVKDGFDHAIICVPDKYLFEYCQKAMDAGFKNILLDKPGAMQAFEIRKLWRQSQKVKAQVRMNYQRSFDHRFSEMLKKVNQLNVFYEILLERNKDIVWMKSTSNHVIKMLRLKMCHDVAMLVSICESANLNIDELSSNGIEWQNVNDTRLFQTHGVALNKEKRRSLFNLKAHRVNQEGAYTKVQIKMTKFESNNYVPIEMKLQFPEQLDQNITWKSNWKDCFKQVLNNYLYEEKGFSLQNGEKVLKLVEIIGQSYLQNKKIQNISLNESNNTSWITLASDSQINQDALMSPLDFLGTGQVIGSLSFFDNQKQTFGDKYCHHPVEQFSSFEDLKNTLDQSKKLSFYYPSLPSNKRDKNIVDTLNHFKNSIVLCEKPSHSNTEDALNFQKMLKDQNLENRFQINYHDSLHSSRLILLDLIKQHQENINSIKIIFNYPKDPSLQGDKRCYQQPFGGVMLDLGVYVFKLHDQIMTSLNKNFMEFVPKNIRIKNNLDNCDYSCEAELIYDNINCYLETKMNPGSAYYSQVCVQLNNGTQLTQAMFVHPHLSKGVFIEYPNGEMKRVEKSFDETSSYSFSVNYCYFQVHPELSLKSQIKILQFIDKLKQNNTI